VEARRKHREPRNVFIGDHKKGERGAGRQALSGRKRRKMVLLKHRKKQGEGPTRGLKGEGRHGATPYVAKREGVKGEVT